MYALIIDNAVARYPYSFADLRRDNPNTSFPATMSDRDLEEWGVLVVHPVTPPTATIDKTLVELTPVFSAGWWRQVWTVQDASAAEIEQRRVALQVNIVAATQIRLDDFARTRNYDSILSACTYATSPTAKFAQEGQYCVDARDATWATLYQLLAEVQAGARPLPSGFEEIEPLLPVLAWPA